MSRRIRPGSSSLGAFLLIALLASSPAVAQDAADRAAALERIIAAAESSLRDGELQTAESHYRSALMAGWMLIGALRVEERRLPEAREAFLRASASASDAKAAFQALAVVHLQMGDGQSAVAILTRVAGSNPK